MMGGGSSQGPQIRCSYGPFRGVKDRQTDRQTLGRLSCNSRHGTRVMCDVALQAGNQLR